MHVIASVRHAIKAELAGVDVVVAEGVESGGACSFDEITTLVLVPQVVDAVKCPVIAAGGIGDARGMVATFALGAEGIQLGTRFVVTHECIAHPSYKDKILQAKDTDTILTGKTVGPMRCLKNAMSEEATKMERQGASPEQMLAFYGLGRAHKGIVEGDVDHGTLYAGEICGMFTRLMSSQEVIQSFVNGWEAIIKRLSKLQ